MEISKRGEEKKLLSREGKLYSILNVLWQRLKKKSRSRWPRLTSHPKNFQRNSHWCQFHSSACYVTCKAFLRDVIENRETGLKDVRGWHSSDDGKLLWSFFSIWRNDSLLTAICLRGLEIVEAQKATSLLKRRRNLNRETFKFRYCSIQSKNNLRELEEQACRSLTHDCEQATETWSYSLIHHD